MRTNGLTLTLLGWLLSASCALAQCIAPDFTAPSSACKGQRLSLVPDNTYDSYEWDLCSGELAGTPTATVLSNSFGGYGFKMELVEDDGDFYGFFLSRGSNKLYRLDFGTSVKNPPLLVDLGGLGKSSSTWRMIEIVKEGADYIGFIIDESTIYRVNFGDSPGNAPGALETFYTGSPMNVAQDAVAIQEGNDRYLFVVNGANDQVLRFKFASSYAEAPASTTMDTFAVTGEMFGSGISAIKDCDKWYLVTSSIIVAGVFKVALDDLSDTTPTVTRYNVPSAGGIAVVKDNSTFMIFAQALNSTSSVFRLNLGASMSNDPSGTDELKDFGYTPGASVFGFAMYKVKSDWLVVSAETSGANMYRVTFPQSCLASTTWSTAANPTVTTENSGSFNITLDVTNGSGLHSSVSHAITVSTSTSPDIEYTSANVCAGNDVDFDSQNTSGGITSYSWNFGDMTSSSSPDPSHTFVAGTYDVSLTVTASSTGCSNTAAHSLKIYAPPVADFQVPAGLICTNNDFIFTNSVTDVYDGNLAYQWIVNGSQVSTSRDLVFAFSNSGSNDVKLVATIPGCFDDEQKTIPGILPGPAADYSVDGQCQATTVGFTNTSTGSATSYSWDFDNGEVSNNTNATTTYDTPGDYTVTLQAFAANGCITTVKKDLTIYSKPVPSFTIDLPPFSCSGTPSQFHDATGSLPDSNVQGWNWTFGDSGSGTGKNPTHTYVNAGQYNVGLTVTTDKGCSNSTTQQVTITQSPVASFNVDPACVNQTTKLTDTSTGGVSSWQWKIGAVVYNSQNPQHTFSVAGNYSVQLNVTGQNSCTSTITKQVVVPVVPTVAFEVRNPCASQDAVFTDVTSSVTDPVAQANWSFDGGTNATGSEVEFAFATAGTYSTSLQVKTQSGCVYSTSKPVTIYPSPVASFTMSDESGPPPLHVFFTNTSTGAISYEWNFSDGNPPLTVVNADYNYTQVGDYAVSLTAANTDGCRKTETKIVSVVVPLNELALEDFSLVQSGDVYLGYVRVRNNGNYRISGFLVTYGVGGGLLLRETVLASLEKGEVGTYVLGNEFLSPGPSAYICAELQGDNNANDNKQCSVFDGMPVVLPSYPNPASTILSIETVQSAAGTIHLRFYSMTGELAYDRTYDAPVGLSRFELNVDGLSPGMYVAVISAAGATSTQRILIAR